MSCFPPRPRRKHRHVRQPRGPRAAVPRGDVMPRRGARKLALARCARGCRRPPRVVAVAGFRRHLRRDGPRDRRWRKLSRLRRPRRFVRSAEKLRASRCRFSRRTAMTASCTQPARTAAHLDSPLAFSMEGDRGQPPSALIARYWAPGWNSVQALNKFQQEIGGLLRGGDPGERLIEPEEAKP